MRTLFNMLFSNYKISRPRLSPKRKIYYTAIRSGCQPLFSGKSKNFKYFSAARIAPKTSALGATNKIIPHPGVDFNPFSEKNRIFFGIFLNRFRRSLFGDRKRAVSIYPLRKDIFRNKRTRAFQSTQKKEPSRAPLWWAVLDLNQWPLRCQRSDLPLI